MSINKAKNSTLEQINKSNMLPKENISWSSKLALKIAVELGSNVDRLKLIKM